MEIMSLPYYGILMQGNIIIMIIYTKAKCNNLCNCNNSDSLIRKLSGELV